MTTTSEKRARTLENNSTYLAGYGNQNQEPGTIFTHNTHIMQHRNGRCYTIETGGPAMAVDHTPRWLSREATIELIATRAEDPVTGYGYTTDQAEAMLAGLDAGYGRRES